MTTPVEGNACMILGRYPSSRLPLMMIASADGGPSLVIFTRTSRDRAVFSPSFAEGWPAEVPPRSAQNRALSTMKREAGRTKEGLRRFMGGSMAHIPDEIFFGRLAMPHADRLG